MGVDRPVIYRPEALILHEESLVTAHDSEGKHTLCCLLFFYIQLALPEIPRMLTLKNKITVLR